MPFKRCVCGKSGDPPLHAVVTVLVVESICRHSLIAGILFLFQHPYSFLVNALIVGCSYSLALLFRKQKSLLVLFTLFWLTLESSTV